MLSGIVTLLRPEQYANAESPMLVTPSPIVMLVRLQHQRHVEAPTFVMLLGIVTLVSLEHAANALVPMLVTLLPNVMLVRLVQA